MSKLERYKIDTSYPGFYNDQNFVFQEKKNPFFLNEYNYYVTEMKFNDEYLSISRNKIDIICQILFEELKKENRNGACIDIAQALTKILEAEKIWCCTFTGSFTQTYHPDTKIDKGYFWLVDDGNFSVPHSWVYAPPYSVIDLSVSLQPYKKDEKRYLPNYVKEINSRKGKIEPIDLINPKIALLQGFTMDFLLEDLFYQYPLIKEFSKKYEPQIIDYEKVTLKYIPIRAGASDGSLEQLKCISFSGKTSFQVYQDRIKPELNKK